MKQVGLRGIRRLRDILYRRSSLLLSRSIFGLFGYPKGGEEVVQGNLVCFLGGHGVPF